MLRIYFFYHVKIIYQELDLLSFQLHFYIFERLLVCSIS